MAGQSTKVNSTNTTTTASNASAVSGSTSSEHLSEKPQGELQNELIEVVEGAGIPAQLKSIQGTNDDSSSGGTVVQGAGLEEEEEPLQGAGLEEEEPLQGAGLEEEEPLQGAGIEEEELMQGKFDPIQKQSLEEEDVMQGKFDPIQKQEPDEEASKQGKFEPIQKKENKTGLPDNLKSGVENLSGMSMDDVKVHYNSSKPAQFQAHAYAQGNQIHLGSGQEKHLPHEAWHVAQQKQGRVKPTRQLKSKVNINDDAFLEKEADVMGAKANSFQFTPTSTAFQRYSTMTATGNEVAQLNPFKWIKKKLSKRKDDDGMSESLLGGGGSSDYDSSELGGGSAAKDEDEEEGVVIDFPGGSYQDGVVTIPIWKGHALTFNTAKKSGSLKGSFPKKTLEPDLPSINPQIDLPIAPGVYVAVGLEIGPTLSLELAGGNYEIGVAENETTVAISDTGITGTLGLGITVTAAVGVGIANVVGLEAGAFGTLGGEAAVSGLIGGNVVFGSGTPTYNMDLALNAGASITGKVGAFVKGKLGPLKATKKFPLAKKTFAHYSYERALKVTNEGAKGLKPRFEDFSKTEYGDRTSGKHLKYVIQGGKLVKYQKLEDEPET